MIRLFRHMRATIILMALSACFAPVTALAASSCDYPYLAKTPWIEPSRSVSPGPRATELVPDAMVAVSPPWSDVPILVPETKYAKARKLLEEMNAAATYQEGIATLAAYLRHIGLIELFPVLRLFHGTDRGPCADRAIRPSLLARTGVSRFGSLPLGPEYG